MAENDRATVQVEDLAYSNMLSINALVELLDEKGILKMESRQADELEKMLSWLAEFDSKSVKAQ